MRRCFAAIVLLFFCLSGCSRGNEIPFTVEASTSQEPSGCTELTMETSAETQPDITIPEETLPSEAAFSFGDLKCIDFYFSSGAGAWSTQLIIHPDGSFSGTYNDHDSIEGEGYPYGISYHCDFTGAFSQPEPVDAYTWSVKLLNITYANTPETEEIKDGVLYSYTTAHGLENGEEYLIYLPGAPLAELPEDFRWWVGYPNLETAEDTVLPFHGFYNEAQQQGFRGTDIVQDVRNMVASAELEELSIDETLQEAFTQADINIAAQTKYQVWDNVLNSLWAVLKRTLGKEAMQQLTAEELDWIEEKEQAILEAGKEVEGGSMYPLVTGTKGAELTKQRVYELLELLP